MSMHDIFVFKQTGVDEDRRGQGYFTPRASGPSAWSGWRLAACRLPVRDVRAAHARPA